MKMKKGTKRGKPGRVWVWGGFMSIGFIGYITLNCSCLHDSVGVISCHVISYL